MRPLPLAILLLAPALPVEAGHCVTWSTTYAELDTGDVAGMRYYVDTDWNPDFFPLPWIYQESNAIPGLQRGDELHDDTCHGLIAPDTIIL